ncbi:MAG: ABC transporter permease [Ignavibacteria bacterium]|jgi:ABC-type antimicrobial peptide transport system permease subunit
MLKNYLKVGIRNLLIHKKYSLINILGLALGFTGFILIMLWVQDELSYDTFHKNAGNTFLVLRASNNKVSAVTSKMLGPAVKEEIPEIVNETDYTPLSESYKPFLQFQDNGFKETIALTDTHFFEVFSFKFIEGNPQTAFNDPNSIVMTKRMAYKYFGNSNALDKSLTITFLGQKKVVKVTGVIKDIPHNTYFQKDLLLPLDFINSFGANWDVWYNYSVQTFIQTSSKIDKSDIEKKILDCENRNASNLNLGTTGYSLLPLGKLHLYSNNIEFFNSTGDIKYVYIFSIVAFIILLIACVNYINLTNAFSLKRTKEIGIKKVVGANWKDLILQYYGETFVIILASLCLSLLFIEMLLPALNNLSGKVLSVNYASLEFISLIIFITVVTTIISGIYPAIFATRFRPVQILKGKFQNKTDGLNLQKGLVILQFALSIAIITCTFIVIRQLKFIQNADLGYDKENIVCVEVNGNIYDKYDAFKNKLLSNPDIINLSRSEPMESLGSSEGISWQGKEKRFSSWILHVDKDFMKTYRIKMKEGRFYSDQYFSDETSAYVINETAAKEMKFKSAIGKEINVWGRKGIIIGVTKDFNFSSLHNTIEPVILRIPNPNEDNIFYRQLSVKINPHNVNESIEYLQSTWKSFYPGEAFNFYFWDESQNASYFAEQRMSDIFKYFSILAIFIACIGLYGLTAFTIERKIKDIGIHKVLGANVAKIVFMLSKKYLFWIVISNAIAFPVVYYFMNEWLRDFAYRIEISWWVFVISGIIALLVALATISFQAIKAATANPVEALRYE